MTERMPIADFAAKATTDPPAKMTKAEQAYECDVLRPKLALGEVHGYLFEPVRLVLGNRCTYAPDFLVVYPDGAIELVDVKALWRTGKAGWKEDARVKIRAAARRFPWFRFVGVHRVDSGIWQREEFKP